MPPSQASHSSGRVRITGGRGTGQDGVEIVGRLAVLYLAERGPAAGLDPGEEHRRVCVSRREPLHPLPLAARLGEAGHRHETSMPLPQPAPPMRRAEVAHVGDAGIARGLQDRRRRGHAPSRLDEFRPVVAVPNDRYQLIGIARFPARSVSPSIRLVSASCEVVTLYRLQIALPSLLFGVRELNRRLPQGGSSPVDCFPKNGRHEDQAACHLRQPGPTTRPVHYRRTSERLYQRTGAALPLTKRQMAAWRSRL